ncbi:MAG: hypothetical protein HWE12_11695 [Oceanospirillaceae bacterium]|nr:hypothetical protein [Oceanospirillaceae bacterium]
MGLILLGVIVIACFVYGIENIFFLLIFLLALTAFQTFDWRVWGLLIFLLLLLGTITNLKR